MGTGEFLLVLFIALIIFGPEKLPGMARTLGRVVRQFKQASDDFTKQVTHEVESIEAIKKDASQQVKSNVGDLAPALRELDPNKMMQEEARTKDAAGNVH